MAGLTWLHLSDWHQGDTDLDRTVVLDALLSDIRGRVGISPDLGIIDVLVFSGDLTQCGKQGEFAAAERQFLEPVLGAAGVPKDRLFLVPGNHDLNWETFELLPEALKRPLASEGDVQHWLGDPDHQAEVLKPFRGYADFVGGYTGQRQPAYASVRRLDIRGKSIGLLGLNSAWMSARYVDKGQPDDYGRLIVGEMQIHDGLKHIADANVRIVVVHHPFSWLAEFDRVRIKDQLRRHCHFVLHGHSHLPDAETQGGARGGFVVIPAGASYNDRVADDSRYSNAYNFVHLDFDGRRGTVYFRRWSDRQNAWIADTDSAENGRYEFDLSAVALADRSNEDVHEVSRPPRPLLRHNLPQPDYDRFVGRDREVTELMGLLLPTTAGFVVAIDGPGGIGKTTLALEVANRYLKGHAHLGDSRFDALVWASAKETVMIGDKFLPRAGLLRTLDDVYRAIAITLGRESILSAPMEERNERIRQALAQQRTLLVIDNLDSVIDAHVVAFISEVTNPTKVLATSRHRIDFSHSVHLVGMTEPEGLELVYNESRLRRVSDLLREDASRLVSYTGGVPLAIRWAVGQIAIGHDVENVLMRLSTHTGDVARFCFEDSIKAIRGRPPHRLLMALSLFQTDASREALGSVAGLSDLDRDDALVELQKLSLLRGGRRYGLLPLIREYSKDDLHSNPDVYTALRQSFVRYFCGFTREYGGDQRDSYGPLDEELENIRLAVEWAYHLKMWNEVSDLVSHFDIYLNRRGLWNELIAYARLGLAASKRVGNTRLIIRNLVFGLGWAKAFRFGLLGPALKAIQASRVLACRYSYQREHAIALRNEGVVYRYLGQHAKAEEVLAEGLSIAQTLCDSEWEVRILGSLGENAIDTGDYVKALAYYERALTSAREAGDQQQVALNLSRISDVRRHKGDLSGASSSAKEALRIYGELKQPYDIAIASLILARTEYALGKTDFAMERAKIAQNLFSDLRVEGRLAEVESLLEAMGQPSLERWRASRSTG